MDRTDQPCVCAVGCAVAVVLAEVAVIAVVVVVLAVVEFVRRAALIAKLLRTVPVLTYFILDICSHYLTRSSY